MPDPEQRPPAPDRSAAPRVEWRLRVPGGRAAVPLLVAAALLVGNNVAVRLTSRPFDEVRSVLRTVRPDADALAFLGGGYASMLLGMRAEGRFRLPGGPDAGQLRVVVHRPTVLHGWRLLRLEELP